MERNTTGLKEYNIQKKEKAIQKVEATIRELLMNGKPINFNIVSIESGISKSFLYKNPETKSRISQLRGNEINKGMNQEKKYEKTSKSKDVIIEAKDKKIAALEVENRQLKKKIEQLRGQLYQQK